MMTIKSAYAHGEFSWVDLSSLDMAQAKQFYTRLFGWDAVDGDTQGGPPYAQFVQSGKIIAGLGELSDEMQEQGVLPTWNSYINVDDAQAIVDRAPELGGTVVVPYMQIMDAGWLAFLADPTGAVFAVWQKNKHVGAELCNEPVSFSWNECATRDIERASDFYSKLLGWKLESTPMGGTEYRVIKNRGRDNGGLLQMTAEWGEMPPHWMVYFAVADTDATAKKAAELGGEVSVPPTDIPMGRFAVITDPQGAVFTVIKLNQPAN